MSAECLSRKRGLAKWFPNPALTGFSDGIAAMQFVKKQALYLWAGKLSLRRKKKEIAGAASV